MKLNLTTKDVLNKTFSKNVKGYDPREVDEFLDIVLKDYKLVDDVLENLNSEISALSRKNEELIANNKKLQNDVTNSGSRTFQVSDYSRLDNLDLLKKISAYELKLYELGVDPSKIK